MRVAGTPPKRAAIFLLYLTAPPCCSISSTAPCALELAAFGQSAEHRFYCSAALRQLPKQPTLEFLRGGNKAARDRSAKRRAPQTLPQQPHRQRRGLPFSDCVPRKQTSKMPPFGKITVCFGEAGRTPKSHSAKSLRNLQLRRHIDRPALLKQQAAPGAALHPAPLCVSSVRCDSRCVMRHPGFRRIRTCRRRAGREASCRCHPCSPAAWRQMPSSRRFRASPADPATARRG